MDEAAAAVAALLQWDRDATVAVAAQQQREQDEAAAVAEQQHIAREEVDDTTVGIIRRVDPLTHSNIYNWPCPPSFQYMDTYQGVHPWKRNHAQPHQYYPLCRIYEHNTDIGVAMMLWQVNSSTILEELTTVNVFQTQLMEASPSLLWLRNNQEDRLTVATAFLSPMNSIHRGSLVTAAIPTTAYPAALVSSTTTSLIDLSVGDTLAATSIISSVDAASNANAMVVDLSVEETQLRSSIREENSKEDEILDDKNSNFPTSRKEYEKTMHQHLRVLYTEPFKFSHREVSIGGRMYDLDCFHYVDSTNSSQPEFNNKRGKKFEFVNRKGENATVYRWELKMAVITSLLMNGKKYDDRVFFAFARYASSISGGKMYDCCAVMIIRCTNRTPVFLMMEVGSVSEEVQCWEGYDKIRHFYVMPEVPIDYDKLSRARLKYWDMNKHLYDESRLIQIDTHRPGDLTVEKATTYQLETSWKMWAIKHGPRDILAAVKIPAEERPLPRAGQMKENAQLREAKTAITAKNAKIIDLEKKIALMQAQQLKAKAAAASSTKRDSRAVEEEEIAPAPSKKRVVVTATSSNDRSSPTIHDVDNLVYRKRPAATTIVQPCPVLVEMSQQLNKTEIEKNINQNKIQILELQLIAAQKQAAINEYRNEQSISKARHNLELNGIHIDQREMQQAARNRQNAINDEDRTFQKESLRRQWLVEDRQVSANKMLDLASKAHELPMLQTLLSAQNANTALGFRHSLIHSPLNTSIGLQSSTFPSRIMVPAVQQFPQQEAFNPPPTQQQPRQTAEEAVTYGSSSNSSTQGTTTAIPLSIGTIVDGTVADDEDFSQYEDAELSTKLLQIQSQLAEEYAKQGRL